MGKRWIRKYKVTKEVDMIAPDWLTVRIDEGPVKIIYEIQDGAETLKGVRIGYETAKIGDTICFNGRRFWIERR